LLNERLRSYLNIADDTTQSSLVNTAADSMDKTFHPDIIQISNGPAKTIIDRICQVCTWNGGIASQHCQISDGISHFTSSARMQVDGNHVLFEGIAALIQHKIQLDLHEFLKHLFAQAPFLKMIV